MFFLSYLRRELRLRLRQVLVIALGLAVGIGLVVVVTAAASGVNNAQAAVLHALYGIGTDVTVTTAGSGSGSGHPPKSQGSHKGFFSPGKKAQTIDELVGADLGLIDQSYVSRLAHLKDVSAASGGLTNLTDTKLTIPPVGTGPSPVSPTTFSVTAVDPSNAKQGPYASATLSSGRGFRASDAKANVADVNYNYAAANKIKVGSTIKVAGDKFTVIGLLRQAGGNSSDVYIPLAVAQKIGSGGYGASLHGKVNSIFLSAVSSADIPTVQKEVEALLPSATVSTSSSLASAVTGSLSSASKLAKDLGKWLAVTVLLASFAIASLLIIAAVGRRTREFGTLKAIGWRSRRIVTQVMGESLVMGLAGAVMGVALGLGGAAVINAIAPTVSATVGANPGTATPENVSLNGTGSHQTPVAGYNSTVAVHLSAPVTINIILLAVGLALAGAIIAGSLGSWRAARLRPANALSRVE